ncbi:MAG: hypothetical protein KJ597_01920 [Nanoarchaeota archaeon]|nr:hypothetical protein [Nanoarchaeota archaeon]MBU1622308.1 hypothetical protein [Nanoarchaeota archaeon]
MVSKKRGQAAGAAVLLVIIAGLLIGFIVMVSPQDRAEILGEDIDSDSNLEEIEDAVLEENLLTVSPGRVDYLAQQEMEHPLPVVNIYTQTEAKILAERNIAYAKKGVFSEEVESFRFAISDLGNTENVLLSFKVDSSEGRLVITLNEESIFDAEVNPGSIQPINLPKNSLRDENILKISASSPGVAFWATNEVSLEEVKIIGDVTNIEAQTSKNIFLVSETEKKNLEKVILKFQPECVYREVGKLIVTVNRNEVYNGIPDCDLAMVPIEFSPELVYQGENEIIFHTEKGTYLLSHVLIESELKEVDFPTYYFELSNEQYEEVVDETMRVRLEMDFVDVVTKKQGDLVINGHLSSFETKEVSFVLDLSDDIVRGNNAIKIKPRRTLEIRELKVDLVD